MESYSPSRTEGRVEGNEDPQTAVYSSVFDGPELDNHNHSSTVRPAELETGNWELDWGAIGRGQQRGEHGAEIVLNVLT